MVIINDEAENTWLIETSESIDPAYHWHIGLSDQEEDGRYLWVDGSVAWENNMSQMFTFFTEGTPAVSTTRNCIVILEWGDHEWSEVDCNLEMVYSICESP